MTDFASLIRTVEDFPKPGIQFKDITPLLQNPAAFQAVIQEFADRFANLDIDCIAAIDARGFIFGGALACKMDKGFVPIRKRGKLPYDTVEVEYDLEYGTDAVAVHEDALAGGKRVLLIDDVIATGGTLAASVELIERIGGEVVAIGALVELAFLNGREKLGGHEIVALVEY
jgi:adenine phosphoribosyltransferase